MSQNIENIVKCRDVSVYYGENKAINSVSIGIEKNLLRLLFAHPVVVSALF